MEAETREQLRDRVILMLNQLMDADPMAIQGLIEYRQRVNESVENLEDNDVVLVEDDIGQPLLGVLGIINGILGPGYTIGSKRDENGNLTKFIPSPKSVEE